MIFFGFLSLRKLNFLAHRRLRLCLKEIEANTFILNVENVTKPQKVRIEGNFAVSYLSYPESSIPKGNFPIAYFIFLLLVFISFIMTKINTLLSPRLV